PPRPDRRPGSHATPRAGCYHSRGSLFSVAAHPGTDGHSRPAPTASEAGAAASISEILRAAHERSLPPSRMKPYSGPPMTLGSAAAAKARIIVWCRGCQHSVEPDPAEMAERYGGDTPVPDWHRRLVCSMCGSREIDFVVTGARR